MNKQKIIDEAVLKAYDNLVTIANLKANLSAGYIESLASFLPKESYQYLDEIIDKLFWKFCLEINTSKKLDISNFHSLCFNIVENEVFNDCLKVIEDCLANKNNEKNLFSLLNPLKEKYPSTNIMDTIFDILIDYYIISFQK